MNCRQLDVREAMLALERSRLSWLVAEYDMGGDEFLSMLRQAQGADEQEVYRLDLGSFEKIDDDLNGLESVVVGGDINLLCEQLLESGSCYLLLDNVRLGVPSLDGRAVARAVTELAQLFLDYCLELKVIIRCSLPFEVPGIKPVVLRPLDEPECKHYVEFHPLAANARKEDIQSGAIHSHTAGCPGRIDKLLKELAVDDFEVIAHGNSDQSIDDTATLPDPLIALIDELRGGDEYAQRVYGLLVALSFFKFGESASTIKYFGSGLRLKPKMAGDLLGLALAESAETYEIGVRPGEQEKFILVKPAVQLYIHRLLGEDAVKAFYEEAASIYFGKDWRIGSYKLPGAARFSDHRIHSVVEQNATLILARIISDALGAPESSSKEKNILDRVRVLHYYLLRLVGGKKYLHVVRLCRAIIPILNAYSDHNLVRDIRYQYARGLRMLGEYEESIRQSEILLGQVNSREIVASVYVNMAYAYEQSDQVDLAEKMASAARDMRLKGDSEYHAKSILLGLSDDPGKYKRLESLARKARRQGFVVSSNNMMLDVIAELSDPVQQAYEYKKLAERAKADNDPYHMMSALVYWAELAIEQGLIISPKDFNSLQAAYTYSCSQRQRGMFSRSHEVLWELLEQAGQVENLLLLFRHSSTLQRLTGKAKVELSYLKRLVVLIKRIGLDQISRNCNASTLRYFAMRADSHNLLSQSQLQLIKGQI